MRPNVSSWDGRAGRSRPRDQRPLGLESLEDRCVLDSAEVEPTTFAISSLDSNALESNALESNALESSRLASELGSPLAALPADPLDPLIINDDLSSLEDPIAADARSSPRPVLEPHEIPGTGPWPNFPQGVVGQDAAYFSLERLTREFLVFDDMRFLREPNFVEDYGLQAMQRYTNWYFWDVGESVTGPVNDTRVREFARRLDPSRLFVVNIESWPTTGSDAVVNDSIAKFVHVLELIREENPQLVMGIYRIPPNREYWTPINYEYGTTQFNAWQAGNAKLQPIADQVDVILPSIYAIYPDYNEDGSPRPIEYDRWVRYATANILEARQFGKPVVAYVWPYYHGGGGSTDPASPDYRYWKFQPIGSEFWRLILDTTEAYADGTIIFGSSEVTWTETLPWWTTTQAFMDEVSAARATAELTTVGSVVAGSYRDTRSDDVASVYLTVTSVNDLPVARNDSLFLAENTPTTINVLANNGLGADSDVDGTLVPTTTTVVLGVTQGTLEDLGAGSFRYHPAPGYQGTDRFTYQVRDNAGGLSNTATVSIVVNSRPIARADAVTTNEDTAVTINVLTSNGSGADSDVDGNLDSASHAVVRAPLYGTISKSTSGRFIYTPAANYFGTDSFTYTVRDLLGAISNEATVTINVQDVNDAPVARADDFTLLEDLVVVLNPTADNGFGADTDVDGTLVGSSLAIVSPPQQGRVTLLGDGTVRYEPHLNYFGTDSFTYRILDDDARSSNVATFTLRIEAVNDAPIAYDDLVLVPPATTTVIDLSAPDSKTPDFDAENGLSEPSILEQMGPYHGTLITLGGTLVEYTPAPGFVGRDTFQYVVNDLVGEGSNVATVTIVVNSAPTARDDQFTTQEDLSLALDVLANNGHGRDFDPESALRTTSLVVTSGPNHGTLVNLRDGQLHYTPDADYYGTDHFTYRIADSYLTFSNPATVTIGVTPLNDAPRTQADDVWTVVDLPITLNVLADNGHGADLDVDGSLRLESLTIDVGPIHGTLTPQGAGQFRYVPASGYAGVDEFTYRIADDQGVFSAATPVRIEVRDENLPPLARPDAIGLLEDGFASIDVLADNGHGPDVDLDGTLVATSTLAVTPPSHGTLRRLSDGRFEYTPAADYFGPDSFSYTVADNESGVSLPAVVSLTIGAVNDPPRLANDQITVTEDVAKEFDVIANNGQGVDRDIDGTIVLSSVTVVEPPLHGNLTSLGSGRYRYLPATNYFGPDQFRYRAADNLGALSDLATVSLTVAAQNDRPVAKADLFSLQEDQRAVLDLIADQGQGPDQDIDGSIVATSVLITTAPAQGTARVLADGRVEYLPAANYFGTDTFQYTVTDNQGLVSLPALVTLQIAAVNDPPVAVDDWLTTPVGQSLSIQPLLDHGQGPDRDVEGQLNASSVTIQSPPSQGTAVVQPDGTIRYQPASGFSGTDTLTYRVQDTAGAISNTAQITIVVNNLPVAQDDLLSTNEDQPAELFLTASNGGPADSDSDGQLALTSVVITQPPTHGQLVSLGGDQFRYLPFANYFGPDEFQYQIADNAAGVSNVARVRISVAAVNDPPVAVSDQVTGVEDLPVKISVLQANGGLADHDVDNAIDVGSIDVVTTVTHGSLLVAPDGSIVYTPQPNYIGFDSFQYVMRDVAGSVSNRATVSIQIDAANLLPQSRPDLIVTQEDKSLTFNVLSNNGDGLDADPDGTIDASSVLNLTWPANGSLSSLGNGSYRYTPFANFHGTDSFNYIVRDNRGIRSKVYEVLSEAVDTSTQISQLEHEWTLQVAANQSATFVVSGYHSSQVESFGFQYSTDRVNWSPMSISLTNAAQRHTFALPGSIVGPLYVRAVDLDRTPGENSVDRLFIDELYVSIQRPQDLTLPAIAIGNVSVAEDGSANPVAQFLVTRTGSTAGSTTVAYETFSDTAVAGTDYLPLSLRTVVFLAGQTEKTISVSVVNDTIAEGAETFGIRFSSVLGGRLTNANGIATILASDALPAQGTVSGPLPATPTTANDGETDEPSATGEPSGTESDSTAALPLGPRILQVSASSTAWQPEFRQRLAAMAGGTEFGWELSVGAAQLASLPWTNVNQLRLRFSEPLAAPHQLGQYFYLASTGQGDISDQIVSLEYDNVSLEVTLTLARELTADKYLLVVRDSLQGTAGHALNGEWADARSESSGDPTRGGSFRFRFNVLPGDIDRNGIVNARDSGRLLLEQRASLRDPTWSFLPQADLDGDGRVARIDSRLLAAVASQRLPSQEPPSPVDVVFAVPDLSMDPTAGEDQGPHPSDAALLDSLARSLRQRRSRRVLS